MALILLMLNFLFYGIFMDPLLLKLLEKSLPFEHFRDQKATILFSLFLSASKMLTCFLFYAFSFFMVIIIETDINRGYIIIRPISDPYLQLVICLAFSYLFLTVVLGLPLWRPWRQFVCGILCISNCVSRYTLLFLFTLRMGSCIKMLQNVTFFDFFFFQSRSIYLERVRK